MVVASIVVVVAEQGCSGGHESGKFSQKSQLSVKIKNNKVN